MEDGDGLTRLFEVSRTMAVPGDGLWALLTDPGRRPAWCPGVVDVEAPPPAPVTVGDTWTDTRDVFGTRETERVAVTEAAEGATLVLEVDGDAGTARSGRLRFTWTLTPVDEGTRVGVACDVGDVGRKGGILLRFLREPWARQVDAELEGLEAALTTAPGG